MKFTEIPTAFTGLRLAWRIAIIAGIVAITVLLADWLFFRPARLQRAAVTAKAEATMAKGESAKAADAAKITEKTHELEITIRNQTAANERTIRAAPDAGQLVAPGVDRAGRAALCMRLAYRHHPSCQQLPGAGAAVDLGADAGG